MAIGAIELVERGGPQVVEHATLTSGAHTLLNSLHDQGILSLRRSGRFLLIHPGTFVGRASHPAGSVNVRPRNPVLMSGLRNFLAAAREIGAADRTTDSDTPISIPTALALKGAVKAVMRSGFPFNYQSETLRSSHPRGQIDFGETLRTYASRGVRHMAVFRVPTRKLDERVTRSVVTAISILAEDPFVDRALIRDLYLLASPLGDRRAHRLAQVRSETASAKEDYATDPLVSRLLTVTETILRSEEAFLSLDLPVGDDGIARFTSMNDVWEVFVHRALASDSTWEVSLHPLRTVPTRLLRENGPLLDPDILVRYGSELFAVVDAKYSVASSPPASDVYQLHAYATRLSPRAGLLVYLSPGDPWKGTIGTTDDGAALGAVGLSQLDIEDSADYLLGAARDLVASD